MQVREKVGKKRNIVFFRGYMTPEGWKVGRLKAAGAKISVKMRDGKLHAVMARSRFGSKLRKNWGVRSSFGTWDDEKVHGIVARTTFGSKKY